LLEDLHLIYVLPKFLKFLKNFIAIEAPAGIFYTSKLSHFFHTELALSLLLGGGSNGVYRFEPDARRERCARSGHLRLLGIFKQLGQLFTICIANRQRERVDPDLLTLKFCHFGFGDKK
jgi:hypothetical protein